MNWVVRGSLLTSPSNGYGWTRDTPCSRTLYSSRTALIQRPGRELSRSSRVTIRISCRQQTTVKGAKSVREAANTKTVRGAKTVRETGKSKGSDKQAVQKSGSSARTYINITGYPFPLGPIFSRGTKRYEVVKNTIWTFEQAQSLGGSNVTTNVRMTVIKLASGGLWVHAPIAPTTECVRLVKELGLPVEYIVLPTFAYEHKIFVGPFSRAFPEADVWVAPRQWSWPIKLPVQFFGIFPKGILGEGDSEAPWASEIEQKIFTGSVGIGPYVEVAFFHKKTRTLLVTDAVICVPESPPEVVEPAALLDAGGDSFFIRVLNGIEEGRAGTIRARTKLERGRTSTEEAQMKLGWRRMVLQILFFVPANLLDPVEAFAALSQRLVVSPVVNRLVFSKVPRQTRDWVNSITRDWNFRQIIPCHFDGPISATPQEFRAAFSFVYDAETSPAPLVNKPAGLFAALPFFGGGAAAAVAGGQDNGVPFSEEDLAGLNALDRFLRKTGVAYEEQA